MNSATNRQGTNTRTKLNRHSRHLLAWLLLLLFIPCLIAQADDQEATDSTSGARPLTPAPGSYRITSEDGVISFPFEIFRGDIRYDAKINGHDVKLLLDDGFMWDDLLFWGSTRMDSLDLNYIGTTSIGKAVDDPNNVPARTADRITLTLPGVEFLDQTALVTSYSSGNAGMWWGSAGQASCTFLKHFVVDINFDNIDDHAYRKRQVRISGPGYGSQLDPDGFWSVVNSGYSRAA